MLENKKQVFIIVNSITITSFCIGKVCFSQGREQPLFCPPDWELLKWVYTLVWQTEKAGQSFSLSLCGPISISRANAHMVHMGYKTSTSHYTLIS